MMNKKVEGLYSNVDEAMQAIDRLREEGYAQEDITFISNEAIRDQILTNRDVEISSQEGDIDHTGDDRSFWEALKDAFTLNESQEEDLNYGEGDHLIAGYREDIKKGNILILVDEDTDPKNASIQSNTEATTQANTVGPEGARDSETEQEIETQQGLDRELTTDELEDYERKQ